jgi:hypothetical protein
VGFNLARGDCNPDWNYMQASVRTQWLPAPAWRLGAEGVFTKVFTAFDGATANASGVNTNGTTGVVTAMNPIIGARPSGSYTISNQHVWAVVVRAQRNFNTGVQ